MTTPSPMSKELIIVSEHFAPSTGATAQLITDLCIDLQLKGVRLRVITSTLGSSDFPFPVHRFSVCNDVSISVFHKATNGILFFFFSLTWLLAHVNKNHSLLIVSNPPFIGLLGVLLSIAKKTRYAFLFQDLFPRSASLTGILPARGPVHYFWKNLLKLVVQRSLSTIVLSRSMTNRCHREYGTSFCLLSIPNWSILPPQSISKDQSKLTLSWGLRDVFTIQYSGNFGRLHDIMTILESARLLKTKPVKFVFIGAGAKLNQISKYCSAFDLDNVLLKPYQPRDRLSDSLAACDISIVSLIAGAEDTVAPSKLYGILASSRPVLLISNHESELSSLISTNHCGVVVTPGDVIGLTNAILKLMKNKQNLRAMGQNARNLYTTSFGRHKSVSDYYQLLRSCEMI